MNQERFEEMMNFAPEQLTEFLVENADKIKSAEQYLEEDVMSESLSEESKTLFENHGYDTPTDLFQGDYLDVQRAYTTEITNVTAWTDGYNSEEDYDVDEYEILDSYQLNEYGTDDLDKRFEPQVLIEDGQATVIPVMYDREKQDFQTANEIADSISEMLPEKAAHDDGEGNTIHLEYKDVSDIVREMVADVAETVKVVEQEYQHDNQKTDIQIQTEKAE